MRGPLVALCFVSLSLGWLILFGSGVKQADWNAALIFLGATSLFYWSFRSGQTPPRIPTWHLIALWALPLYAAFQLLPLPIEVLEWLSPARAQMTTSLGGVMPNIRYAPLSIAPAAAAAGLFSLLGFLTVFSLLRDIKWRFVERRPWLTVAPIAVIAVVEAGVGLGQWILGPANVPLHGTLLNNQQFEALLEIALPFTLIFGFISLRRHQTQEERSAGPAIRAAASWAGSLLILADLFHSNAQTSRMVVFGSMFVLLTMALVPRLRTKKLRWYGAASVSAVALMCFLLIAPPTEFVESLAQIGSTDKAPAETRLAIWNNSAALLNDYRWLGTGIGGFEPAFLKYQGSSDLNRVANPHNDALELFITWGLVGGCLALVAVAGVLRPAIIGAFFLVDEPRRLLAASIVAALAAALFRSTLESALSAPFLAMSFAWLAGVSQSSD